MSVEAEPGGLEGKGFCDLRIGGLLGAGPSLGGLHPPHPTPVLLSQASLRPTVPPTDWEPLGGEAVVTVPAKGSHTGASGEGVGLAQWDGREPRRLHGARASSPSGSSLLTANFVTA